MYHRNRRHSRRRRHQPPDIHPHPSGWHRLMGLGLLPGTHPHRHHKLVLRMLQTVMRQSPRLLLQRNRRQWRRVDMYHNLLLILPQVSAYSLSSLARQVLLRTTKALSTIMPMVRRLQWANFPNLDKVPLRDISPRKTWLQQMGQALPIQPGQRHHHVLHLFLSVCHLHSDHRHSLHQGNGHGLAFPPTIPT